MTRGTSLSTHDSLKRGDIATFLQFPLFALDFGLGMTGAYLYVRLRRGELAPLRRYAGRACLAAAAALVVLAYFAGLPVARGSGGYWGESSLLAGTIRAMNVTKREFLGSEELRTGR